MNILQKILYKNLGKKFCAFDNVTVPENCIAESPAVAGEISRDCRDGKTGAAFIAENSFKMPGAIRIQLCSVPESDVTGKDIFFFIKDKLAKEECINKCMEIGGDSLSYLDMKTREEIASLAHTGNFFCIIFECDYQSVEYMLSASNRKFHAFFPDGPSDYEKIFDISLSDIKTRRN